jgi:hypothetical protein
VTAHGIRLLPHREGGPAADVVYGGIALGAAGQGDELVLNGGLDVHGCVLVLIFFCVLVVLFYGSEMAAGGDGVNAVDAMQNVLIL